MVTRALRDRRGATVLETALVLPVFVLLILILFETAWQLTLAAAVDHGARRGARWVSLGAAPPSGMTRLQRLTEIVVTSSGLPLDPSRISVTPTAFASYSQIGVTGAGTAGLGAPDGVVQYVIRYRSEFLIPLVAALFPSAWLDHRSVVIEQNEPYPDA